MSPLVWDKDGCCTLAQAAELYLPNGWPHHSDKSPAAQAARRNRGHILARMESVRVQDPMFEPRPDDTRLKVRAYGYPAQVGVHREELHRWALAMSKAEGWPALPSQAKPTVLTDEEALLLFGLAVDALAEHGREAINISQAVKLIEQTAARRGRDMTGFATSTLRAKAKQALDALNQVRPAANSRR